MTKKAYVVKQGDFMARIAHEHGLDKDEVWQDSANEDLRKLRANPDMLVAGDVIYFEEPPKKWLDLKQGTANDFSAVLPSVKARVRFVRDGRPLTGVHYCLSSARDDVKELDGDGCAEVTVPITTRSVTLLMLELGEAHEVKIGHLDPPDTPTGAQMRLACLGLYGRPAGVEMLASDEQLAAGLRAFQRRAKLEVTGVLDDKTVKKLVDEFGA